MANDRHDDDVIVISEEDVRYEDADENGDLADPDEPGRQDTAAARAGEPAADDLADNDQSTREVPGRFGPATPGDPAAAGTAGAYGTAAADTASPASDAADVADATDPEDHPVTQPVSPAAGTHDMTGNGAGSAIPMPGATSADTPAATDATVTPTASATPAAGHTESDANWPQIQALFVDDPLAAVQQAADVAGGALAALLAAANNREQTLRGSWEGGDSIGTEDLRNALREYRELAGRLSTLSRDF
jgi:hypothetical protein